MSKKILLGNEAIALGAIEAKVRFATGYPGTPSSEVLETLIKYSKTYGFYANWAVNEKVAFEKASAAAQAGERSLVTMKHLGLNVAADPLMTLTYEGVLGGMVIFVADDPQCFTSQNEQDPRFYGIMAKIPIFEPTSPQEAKCMIVDAFDLSEKIELPVILRSTPRLSHSSGEVEVTLPDPTEYKNKEAPVFKRDPKRWISVGPNALERHKWLEERQSLIEKEVEKLSYNTLIMNGDEEVGIIASGLTYNYVIEALKELHKEDTVAILKIGTTNPLPKRLIERMLRNTSTVVVIEELDPIVEYGVRVIANKLGVDTKIIGKLDGYFPAVGEYSIEVVLKGLNKIFGWGDEIIKIITNREELKRKTLQAIKVPSRPLSFCPGCPHRASYYALKKACRELGVRPICTGDIGCYTIGMAPPFELLDTLICMGSSISQAEGLHEAGITDPIIAVIGDSTFYHTGIPPLIDAVWNSANITILIMDNRITAMTGHQPCPSTDSSILSDQKVEIPAENILKSVGVNYVKVVDPYNLKEAISAIKEAITFKGVSCVILRQPCALIKRRKGFIEEPYEVDQSLCVGCRVCVIELGCPAIYIEDSTNKAKINPSLCIGCGVCAQVCPAKAIKKTRREEK